MSHGNASPERQATPTNIYPVSPSALREVSEAINEGTRILAELSGPVSGRSFRSLRTQEVLEVSGATQKELQNWRNAHLAEISSYQSFEHSGMSKQMFQVPLTLDETHRFMRDRGYMPSRPPYSRAMRLGVFSFKGGVTKSSTTLNLSVYYAMHGWRVLIIDSDPQGSLSTMFDYQPEDVPIEDTLGPAFQSVAYDSTPAADLRPRRTHIDGLDIIPASLDMTGVDFDVTSAFMARSKAAPTFYDCIANSLARIEEDYDLIFIDGAPAFSFTTLAAMWAVDGMIIPVPPSAPDYRATASFCAMAADGLERLCERAGRQSRTWAPLMFLHSRVKPKSQSSEIIQSLAKRAFIGNLSLDSIPEVSAVPNALNLRMSVWEATSADVGSRGLRVARSAYARVAEGLLERIKGVWATDHPVREDTP